MKSVELNLNKRLLIVEVPQHSDMNNPFEILQNSGFNYLVFSQCKGNIISRYKMPDGDYKLICKGPELTEDIAKGLVELHGSGYYKDYLNDNNFFTLPSKSFISDIESKGYHWGENPVKFKDNEMNWEKRHKNRIEWEQAESRTFNPSQCIIFEIV